ncbi:MAG TPA: hypothetical protein PLV91_04610 [Verrucomicrobiota bacterium]|jgi:hypothetical protein|nr:hypothetical protein [Verrucomicrobiota bacterium]
MHCLKKDAPKNRHLFEYEHERDNRSGKTESEAPWASRGQKRIRAKHSRIRRNNGHVIADVPVVFSIPTHTMQEKLQEISAMFMERSYLLPQTMEI